MSQITYGTGYALKLDKEKGRIEIISEVPTLMHVNEFVAAVHDDPTGSFYDIRDAVVSGTFKDEPKLFSVDLHNNVYVQSDYATGIHEDPETKDVLIDEIIIMDVYGRKIVITVDTVPTIDKGDVIDLNPKWGLKVVALKTINISFFMEMLKAKSIDIENVTNDDLKKLIDTEYFARPKTSHYSIELEGTAVHFNQG